MPFTAITSEDWTAAGTWATCFVLLMTLIYVARQVRDARELRREQFRPWLAISFHFRSILAFVAVKNHGTTAARNVRIRFEPEFESTLDIASDDVAMFGEETPVMVPGEERLFLFDRVPDRLQANLPKRHEVVVEYSDHRGRTLPTERFVLDFGLLDGARLPDKGLHDLVEELSKLRQQMSTSGE
jgi:hypothetical protein